MPGIIGYNTIGGTTAADTGSNWPVEATVLAANRYTASAGDTVTQVAIYGDGDGTAEVSIFVYSGGVPTTRVGSPVAVTIGTAANWYTASASIALSAGVEYVVAIDWFTSAPWNGRYDSPGGTATSQHNDVTTPTTWSQASTGGDIISFYATVTSDAATEQEGFRFRADNGSETTATWPAAQDTNITSPLDTPIRLRALINATGDVPSTQYRLEYKEDSEAAGLWRPIGQGLPGAAPTVRGFATATNRTDMAPGAAATLPTRAAGDLLIAFQGVDTTATAITRTQTTEWAQISEEAGGATRMAVFARIATNDANDNLTIAGPNSNDGSGTIIAIQTGTHGVTNVATDIVAVAQAQNTTGNADPPSIDGGSAKNWLAIAVAVVDLTATGSTVSAAPTNYTTGALLTKSASSTSSVGLGVGYRSLSAAQTENPGTFTNTSGQWQAKTLLIPPALGTPGIDVATSTNYADGDATTAQLTAPSGKTTSDFDAGVMVEGQALADAVDITADDYTEIEWAIEPQSPAVNAEVYQFRVTANGTALNTYTVTPELTIGDSGVREGSASGAIGWAGSSTGVRIAAGLAAGALSLVGVATGQNGAGGSSSGTIAWAGSVTGTSAHQGASTGTISWAGTATGRVPIAFPFPASISGRHVLDQNGDPILWVTMSSWSLADLSAANITTALEGMVAAGINGVTVWAGGGYRQDATWDPRYSTKELLAGGAGNDAWWTGTAWQSSFGAAWDHMDHIADECLRLGLILSMSTCLSWGSTGAAGDIVAASNTQMATVGTTIANRYPVADYPNIVWHIMFDSSGDANQFARMDAMYGAIEAVEGSARPVRWAESTNNVSVYDLLISTDAVPNFGPSMNGYYDNWFGSSTAQNRVEMVEASYAEAAIPTGDVEPGYDGSPYFDTGNMGQQLREQTLACFIEGGSYINHSQESWWPFGKSGWVTDSEGLDWTDVPTHSHTLQQGYILALCMEYVAHIDWAPTSSFVTTGEGSGDTKAAVGTSGVAALAYFPDNRTIQVDTTIITGTGNVRLRWFDPVLNSYSTIAATEAQQTGRSVTLPAARGDGTRDFVLVVDGATTAAGSASGTISWAGSATGTHVSQGAGTGAIGWVGTATGTHVSQGASTGTIGWSGSATGTAVHAAGASGTISWAGSATGAATHAAGASGTISWVGSATGEAPAVGVNDGAANGTISWVGTATGTHVSRGAGTGTISWVGTATGTHVSRGAGTGAISWVGSATGETPALNVNDGSANGTISWVGVATGEADYQAAVVGAITWAGTVTGITDREGLTSGTISWVGVVVGEAPPPYVLGTVSTTISGATVTSILKAGQVTSTITPEVST